jgi:hypothetical protein
MTQTMSSINTVCPPKALSSAAMCLMPPHPLYPSAQSLAAYHCHPTWSQQPSMQLVMISMPSPYKTYVRDYSKLSDSVKQLIMRWKTILASRYEGWVTRWQNTRKPMTKSLKATLKTHDSSTSKCPSVWGSIYPSNGSSNLMTALSPAIWLMMAHKTLCTSCPSTHPCYHQMICQLDLFHGGSMEFSPDCMPVPPHA